MLARLSQALARARGDTSRRVGLNLRPMRVVVRIALVLSAVAVLVTVGIYVEAVHDLNEWGDGDTSGWVGVLYGLLVSLIPLAFIWLGVFVVYVIAKGARVLGR
jgi:uncharacterized BrkB/YihY/UPF0761 family membrane protein